VLTLDAPHPYTVSSENGELHIRVDGATAKFEPWQVASATAPAVVRDVSSPKASTTSSVAAERPVPVEKEVPLPVQREVKEEAPAAPAPRRELAFSKREAAPQLQARQQRQEPHITNNWEDASISDVLATFAAFTGRTILPSKNVTGKVTASIIDLPWDVALKEIMNANGYDVSVNPDGVIVVDTYEAIAARQATIPLQNRTVRLNYSRALGVKDMVAARLTRVCAAVGPAAQASAGASPTAIQSTTCPARGTVTADTITNSISITDIPSALPELVEYTKSLDLRQPQVNIKAKIILVDRSTLEGLGLRYDIGTRSQFFNDIVPRLDSLGQPMTQAGQILLGGNAVSAIANASARVPGAALQLVYSTAMGNYDFTTFLEALQTNTLLDVQAEPSTTILSNRTANLTAGTQVPIRVIDAGSASGNTSNAPRANVTMQQTGVILTVTPQVTANRQVQMRVHVENSDVQFQSNDVGAVFPTQKVDNEVLVADGETAVMGGLTQTTVSISKSGIPVLVDLPIIGRLFGVTNRRETKRDLLILITPHIIDDGQQPDNR
jgi:type IV pilus assembly protein PilQ